MSSFRAAALGAPVMDFVIRVDESFLASVEGEKGGMVQVDYATFERYLGNSGAEPVLTMGGCEANTIKGLAGLGHRCSLIGKVGDDTIGRQYRKKLEDRGMVAHFAVSARAPSGRVLCIITPDGERTMRSFFGASVEYALEDLESSYFNDIDLLHTSGHSLFWDGVTEKSMQMAKAAGALVSMDLASFEVVRRFKPTLYGLLENYVDVVFANEAEAREMTGRGPAEACRELGGHCDAAVVHMGIEGCYVFHKGVLDKYKAYPVADPVDTTGAGDLFSSGFLHGYLRGDTMERCAHYGAILGAGVVRVPGTDLAPAFFNKITG